MSIYGSGKLSSKQVTDYTFWVFFLSSVLSSHRFEKGWILRRVESPLATSCRSVSRLVSRSVLCDTPWLMTDVVTRKVVVETRSRIRLGFFESCFLLIRSHGFLVGCSGMINSGVFMSQITESYHPGWLTQRPISEGLTYQILLHTQTRS